VAHTLENRLARDGHSAKTTDGNDAKGIDRTLAVDGEHFVLQITLAPQNSDFWRNGKHSSASTQISQTHAASWIRDAILGKSTVPATQNAPVVLAIDVRHGGILAISELVSGSLNTVLPRRNLASLLRWLVGPTAEYCSRWGQGRP
jgi:hypothetical protein